MTTTAALELVQLTKRYGSATAVDAIHTAHDCRP